MVSFFLITYPFSSLVIISNSFSISSICISILSLRVPTLKNYFPSGGSKHKPNFFNITSHACKTYVGPGALGTAAYAVMGVPTALFLSVAWPVRNMFKKETGQPSSFFFLFFMLIFTR